MYSIDASVPYIHGFGFQDEKEDLVGRPFRFVEVGAERRIEWLSRHLGYYNFSLSFRVII